VAGPTAHGPVTTTPPIFTTPSRIGHPIDTPAGAATMHAAGMSKIRILRPRAGALLCEFHAHTTWSDGELPMPDAVDAYGLAGFDVLCITDHVLPDGSMVSRDNYDTYLAAIRSEATRAFSEYGMLVVPGVELTWDDVDETRAAHAVVVGLDRFVGLDDGLPAALETARMHGAAVIAAHPHAAQRDTIPGRTTQRWWLDGQLRSLAHRFELINRSQVFGWVAEQELPAVANGDFHRIEHLDTWKTVIAAERDPDAIVAALRSRTPMLLTSFRSRPRPHSLRVAGGPVDVLVSER